MLGVFANLADIGFTEQVNCYKQTQYLRAALLGQFCGYRDIELCQTGKCAVAAEFRIAE